MVVLVLERGAELLVEVVDRERAVDPDRRLVDPLDRLVRQVELVLDLADDLLEQILEGDDALHRAVLVDDDRHVLVRAAELGQQRGEILRLRHDVGGPEEGSSSTSAMALSWSAEKRSRTCRIPTISSSESRKTG